MSAISEPANVTWIDIPQKVGSSFLSLEECADYVHQLAEAREVVWYSFRFPDHLIPHIPRMDSNSHSSEDFTAPAVLGAAAGIAKRSSDTETCPRKSTRRSLLRKTGVASALLLALGINLRTESSAQSCSCFTWWSPDEYCVWQSYCGGLGVRVYRLWYTFDTLGSCDSYCYSQLWSINCC